MSEINVDAFRMINDIGKEYTSLNPIAIFIAEYMVFFLALAMLVYWFTRTNKNRMMVLCAMISFLAAELLAEVVGRLHSNNQPFAELPHVNKLIEKAVNNSFPSDHTMLFFSICVTFWFFRRGWSFLWVVLAVLVGISRIWVGVHYPADVLVGALISIVSAYIVYRVVPELGIVRRLLVLYDKGERFILSPFAKSKDSKSKDF
ncbi:undecaprenyl-diphosphatase [Peribacillus deserti]|uniref:Undecaprenyl-diphosphatase n=1 Tax=Peribacillus deserti TaxID=673318 RepID=A0A2N5LZS9_9BACI|nr:undecaprenyl-diphosphatase [Peribacillus deserti]PLT27614.1 undecaprenyl-diphosphatase [Peribacillus deserti]